MRNAAVVLGLLSTLACSAGCESSSQVVIGVLTNLAVKGELDEVSMLVTRNGGVAVLQEDWSISNEEGLNFVLPGSFTVYSPEGGAPSVEITVTGLLAMQPLHTRIADLALVSQDELFFRMSLTADCGNNGPAGGTCPDGQTCVEGLCRDQTVDSKTLPKFNRDLVTTVQCDSGEGYIDTGTCGSGSCEPIQPSAQLCPTGQFCREGTCYLRDPASPRVLDFGESCDKSQGDTCGAVPTTAGGQAQAACVATGSGANAGLQSCRLSCTTDAECQAAELPGASAAGISPAVARCDTTAGACTFACDPLSAGSGCAAGSRCDLAYPTPTTVGVDCVDATLAPGEQTNLPEGSACTASRDCALGSTCYPLASGTGSVCRELCSIQSEGGCTDSASTCIPVFPPMSSAGPSTTYGVCCPPNGCPSGPS